MTLKLKSGNWDKNHQASAAIFLSSSLLCLKNLSALFSHPYDVIKLPASARSGTSPSSCATDQLWPLQSTLCRWWSLPSVPLETTAVSNWHLRTYWDGKPWTDVVDTSIESQDRGHKLNKLKSRKMLIALFQKGLSQQPCAIKWRNSRKRKVLFYWITGIFGGGID